MTPDSGLDVQLGPWAAGFLPAPSVGPDYLSDLRARLEAAAAPAATAVPDDADPVRLNKRRLSALLDCERHLLATLDLHTQPNEPIIVGALIDVLADLHTTTGATPDDAFEAAYDLLVAAGDPASEANVAWLDSLPPADRTRIAAQVAEHRDLLLAGWPVFEPSWGARTQERASLVLAGGRVVIEGRFDVTLGGHPTQLPTVVIEVKAGMFGEDDHADMLLFALLVALRDGIPPALVVTCRPGTPPIVEHVRAGHLEAAARRLEGSLGAVARLANGGEAKTNPTWRCGTCPAACPHAGTRPVRSADGF
jgi:hypothetical protein